MTKYLDPNQSAARNRQLKRYLDSSKDKVDKSVQEISNIRSEFGEWRKFTGHLLRALEATASACGDTVFKPLGSAQLTRDSNKPAARATEQERT